MFSFAPLSWWRRPASRLAGEWLQLVLWLALGRRFLTSTRSAFRSGAAGGSGGRAVRPRRCRRPLPLPRPLPPPTF